MKKPIHYLEFLEMNVNLKLTVEELQDLYHVAEVYKTQCILNGNKEMGKAIKPIIDKMVNKINKMQNWYDKNQW